jgi:hypothetical protein
MGGHLGASYAYTDTVPLDGVWWYWLVDVDTHGAETHARRPACVQWRRVNTVLASSVFCRSCSRGRRSSKEISHGLAVCGRFYCWCHDLTSQCFVGFIILCIFSAAVPA